VNQNIDYKIYNINFNKDRVSESHKLVQLSACVV